MDFSNELLVVLILSGSALAGLIGVSWFRKRDREDLAREDAATKTAQLREPLDEEPQVAPKSVVEPSVDPVVQDLPAAAPVEVSTPKDHLFSGLVKTRDGLRSRISQAFGMTSRAKTDEAWEAIEEALLGADVGVRTTQTVLERVKAKLAGTVNGHIDGGAEVLLTSVRDEVESVLGGTGRHTIEAKAKPHVISLVGVNGVGKTTTAGKLGAMLQGQGSKVLMGATDTFRAAAVEQLRVWAERSGAEFVSGREGGDPGAVAFDAVAAGKARGSDFVILDTAGRLHTKSNLMDELVRVHRVVKKVIPEAPHDIWLVVDGTLGQNSLRQAEEFGKALELSGIVVTKLDGTAKGGAVIAIAEKLNLPVKFVGVGESVADLIPFRARAYASAMLGVSE